MLVNVLENISYVIANLHSGSVGVGGNGTTVGLGVTLLHLADVLLGVVESLLGTGHFDSGVVVEVEKCSLVVELKIWKSFEI